jgi:hypothetical protein
MRAAAVAIAVVVAAAGCAGARNALGTNASACFKALPGANAAVHDKGHLVGVRRVEASTMQKRFPQDPQLDALPPGTHLCVFAFRGTFKGANVDLAPETSSGTYAIVALTGSRPTLVSAHVVDQLPTRFRHTRA